MAEPGQPPAAGGGGAAAATAAAPPAPAPTPAPAPYYVTPTLDDTATAGEALVSLNEEGVWSLSSARPGTALPELLSEDTSTFWQTDSMPPHSAIIQFYTRQPVAEVALYLTCERDESYTPEDVIIAVGMNPYDTEDVRRVKLVEPTGWVRIPLLLDATKPPGAPARYLHTHCVMLTVRSNHQGGRDLHIHGLKVLGPPSLVHRIAGGGAGEGKTGAAAAAAPVSAGATVASAPRPARQAPLPGGEDAWEAALAGLASSGAGAGGFAAAAAARLPLPR